MRLTAKEVLERSAEMSKLLGETYGRLQTELLTPLVNTAVKLLQERNLIPMTINYINDPNALPPLQEGEVDIPAFTPAEVEAISSLPLSVIKSVVTQTQFEALTKFVNINQMVLGHTTGKSVPRA